METKRIHGTHTHTVSRRLHSRHIGSKRQSESTFIIIFRSLPVLSLLFFLLNLFGKSFWERFSVLLSVFMFMFVVSYAIVFFETCNCYCYCLFCRKFATLFSRITELKSSQNEIQLCAVFFFHFISGFFLSFYLSPSHFYSDSVSHFHDTHCSKLDAFRSTSCALNSLYVYTLTDYDILRYSFLLSDFK